MTTGPVHQAARVGPPPRSVPGGGPFVPGCRHSGPGVLRMMIV
ncbi:hypothetical protein KPATCC21470_4727 [Kitasatospora purpeofusca]